LCAMSALTTYSYYRERGSQLSRQIHSVSGRTHAQGIIKKAYQEHRTNLLETEARSILHEYGIEVPRYEVAHSAEEAAKVAGGIGFPIVMKVLSKDIIHKSDIGGVRLNLCNKAEVKKSFEEMMQEIQKRDAKAKIEGILLTPYQLGDTDVIIGLQNESQFGPVIMFGLGGIFVEIIKDVAFRVAPIDKQEGLKMIGEIKGFKTLTGIRGQKPKDIDLLAEILVKVGKIGLENLEIESIDLNPIRVLEKGAAVLDARVILKPNS
jgi:acyl-CoA synthetase (NDP forming)